MKAITFEAHQSRNLTLTTNLDRSVFKSVSKSQVRRLWLRLNLAVRSWQICSVLGRCFRTQIS